MHCEIKEVIRDAVWPTLRTRSEPVPQAHVLREATARASCHCDDYDNDNDGEITLGSTGAAVSLLGPLTPVPF